VAERDVKEAVVVVVDNALVVVGAKAVTVARHPRKVVVLIHFMVGRSVKRGENTQGKV
jgi:hypothetical protein